MGNIVLNVIPESKGYLAQASQAARSDGWVFPHLIDNE
jgi:hypothetical protein